MEQAEIPFADLPFDRTEVCRGLGITQASAPEQFEILLDEAISEAARRCRPQYAYRLFPTERIDPDSISAGGAKFATGHVITRYLKNAEYLAFFIATAGREFDAWLRELKTEDDILKEFLADAIGSEIAEATPPDHGPADERHPRRKRHADQQFL